MKLTVILLIATFMQVSAETYAQKVSFSKKNASMREVIEIIQSQTGYNFIISSDLLRKAAPVNIDLKDTPLKEALNQSFSGQPFEYVINKKTIVVSQSEGTSNSLQNAQVITVTGKITNEKGNAISGVNIKVKDGQGAAASDANGNYNIRIQNRDAVLIYSFVGYSNQEVKVAGRNAVNIVLKPQVYTLDETVVIGYGTVSRRDLTGSVGQVDLEDLAKAPVTTFTQALAGRVAGVQVSSSEGQPGMMQDIVIRGPGTLTQDASPLYVVDGFALEDFDASSLNTNDIESISVLKDASATAIYGSRAANGVIVIETKKGAAGRPKVTLNSSFGFNKVRKTIDVMEPYDFVNYQNEFNPSIASRRYFDVDRDGIQEKSLESYRDARGVNWQDELFTTSPMQIYDLSIRGGNADTRYSVSGSLFDNEGIILNTGASRSQGRIALDHTLSRKLRVGVTANYSVNRTYGAQASTQAGAASTNSNSIFYPTFGYRPISGRDDIDISSENIDDLPDPAFPNETRVNPVKQAKNAYEKRADVALYTNAFLSYTINRDLILRVTGNNSMRSREQESFFSSKTPRGLNVPQNVRGVQASVNYANTDTWSSENTLTYTKRFNSSHQLTSLLGFSVAGGKNKSHGVFVMNIPNEELGMSGMDEGTPYLNPATSGKYTMASFFGRLNYNYKSKYLLTATFRADGSSKFPTENKWGYFPSGAIAWNLGQEDFLKAIPTISTAKLRASYGVTGNNRVSEFGYLPNLAFPIANSYSFNNSSPIKGAVPSGLGNSNLKWESTEQADVGLDLGLWKDRVELVVDVYRKTTNDMLLYADLPFATGYSRVYQNIGKLENEGLEISLNAKNIVRNSFNWESSFNISFNRNKILALARGQNEMYNNNVFHFQYTEALYISEVGQSAGKFYGYEWLGNYQYADFDETAPGVYLLKEGVADNGTPRDDIQPGDIKYRDINEDGVVNDLDKTTLGRSLPLHSGGFNNNFRYKNFDLNLFLQWSYGNSIYNANRLIFEGNSIRITDINQFASYNDRWTPDNQTNENYRTGGGGVVGRNSSRVLEDGSYLRLKTVSLGYSLPASLVKKLSLNTLTFTLSGQNLLTWTNYTGFDPEVAVRNSVLTPGLDYSAYPHTRSFVFGINASF